MKRSRSGKAFLCVVCDQGFDPDQMALILEHFKTCRAHEEQLTKELEEMNKPFVFPFANKKNEKGLTLDKVSSESLLYLIERSDCNDPQYGERNSKIVAECNKVLNERAQGQTVKASVSPASQTVHATTNGNGAPTASMTLLKQVAAQQAEHGKVLARILGVLNSNFPNSQEVHTDEEFDKF